VLFPRTADAGNRSHQLQMSYVMYIYNEYYGVFNLDHPELLGEIEMNLPKIYVAKH
jgi:hypothetical protein